MKRWRNWQGAGRAVLALLMPLLIAANTPVPVRHDTSIESALRRHVETLASDDFGGREPGTDGEMKTLRYLARQWYSMGLTSGTNDPANPWFAPVEIVERVPSESRARFSRGRRRVAITDDDVLVLTSGRRSLIENAPLLFLGKDTNPETARTELAGRIAVVLDSQAGAQAGPGGADDRPGRLLAAGAAAVITVLDGDRALDDVAARRRRAGYALEGDHVGGDIEAFMTPAVAEQLLAAGNGGHLAELANAGRAPGFVPRLIGVTGTLEATGTEKRIHTHNLIGRIEGRRHDLGAVLLVAHWDHFGKCAQPPAEHLICNGAVDNASGLAVITEAARQIAASPHGFDRDVYVLATTGEELGLLGAEAFASNPPIPLDRIVAAFNVDSTGIVPQGMPVTVVGSGMTDLDPGIAAVMRGMHRRMVAGGAANAFVRRQDSWVFIQHDVPAVMVSSAYSDPVRLDHFMDERYHRPTDVAARVDYGGMVEDVAVQVELVRYFADSHHFPGPTLGPGAPVRR